MTLDVIMDLLDFLPRLPLGDVIERFIDWLLLHIGGFTRAFSEVLHDAIRSTTSGMLTIPPILLILFFTGIAWRFSTRATAIFTFLGLLLIYNMELWPAAMSTLAMVLLAALLAIAIGMPLGILCARSDVAHGIVWPILDLMQTLPPFVYLIPVIFFFRLGPVPAVMATFIFSMPPVIRLTSLGIRQVPKELIEACSAFGSTSRQKLFKIQLPLAMPTIMAGINQCIMLSLSMVVIAAMIGAGGLGGEVWRAIQRLDIGGGFESGLAVVVVAIVLDRIMQRVQKSGPNES